MHDPKRKPTCASIADPLASAFTDIVAAASDDFRDRGWPTEARLFLVAVGTSEDSATVEATPHADLAGPPQRVLLGWSAPAEADGVVLVWAEAPDGTPVVRSLGVLRDGSVLLLRRARGTTPRHEDLAHVADVLPVLRRTVGLPSGASHGVGAEVAAGFAARTTLELVRTGHNLADRDLARRFLDRALAELREGADWRQALRRGLKGEHGWALGCIEAGLQAWADEDLAIRLLESRALAIDDALVEIASLIDMDAATRLRATLEALALN